MEFLSQYGLFFIKTITLLIAFLVALAGFLTLARRGKPQLEIVDLNKQYDEIKRTMYHNIADKKTKKPKKAHKQDRPKLFVLSFHGDMKATQVEQLRDEITAILSIAIPGDEVLLKLDSPGGSVNGYGLGASQLQRLRQAKIPLTICIDKIAASGGYLMACAGNHIVAAPFAIIGSIGVVAQIPNFHKLLTKNDIDVELMTAGEYKRTLTMLGEITKKGKEKFQEDLEKIHEAFQDTVLINRPDVPIKMVATGEHWLAKDSLPLKLIDELATSDDIIIKKMQTFHAFKVTMPAKPTLMNKICKPIMRLLHPWG